MKQETKELIDWIKKQINIAKTNNMNWRAYLKPKSWYKANKINSERGAKSFLFVGRRFGKTRLASIEVSAFIGGEKGRRAAIEFWNKVDRGEIEI